MLCYLPTLAPSPDRYGTFTGPRTDSLPPSLPLPFAVRVCVRARISSFELDRLLALTACLSSSRACRLAGYLSIPCPSHRNPNLPLLRSLACFAISISALFFSFPRLRAKHPLAPSSLPPIPINQPSFPPTNELFVCVSRVFIIIVIIIVICCLFHRNLRNTHSV